AITGTGESRTILGSASASSLFGTATRTTSQPAEASAAIWAVVASTSCVFVNVIDCTTTDAPPPIWTPPTWIERSLDTPGSLAPADVSDVVRKPDEEQQQHQSDANRGHPFVDRPLDRTPADALDDRERNVAAVERQQRQ